MVERAFGRVREPLLATSDKMLQPLQRDWHIRATVADPEVIACVLEAGTGEKQNTFALDQVGAEAIDCARLIGAESRKRDAPGARSDPRELSIVLLEKAIEHGKIS